MNNKDLRKQLLAEHLIKSFKRRNMEAVYCATSAEAVATVSDMIPDGSTVSWGGSMSIRDMGLSARLHERDLNILDRDRLYLFVSNLESFLDHCLS